MSIELNYQTKENYLLVHASGKWTAEAAIAGIRQIQEKANATGLTHILIDCNKISPPDMEFTRYLTGEAIASELRYPIKAAAVLPIELINKFAENVATNRGAKFLATHDYESAFEWLWSK